MIKQEPLDINLIKSEPIDGNLNTSDIVSELLETVVSSSASSTTEHEPMDQDVTIPGTLQSMQITAPAVTSSTVVNTLQLSGNVNQSGMYKNKT